MLADFRLSAHGKALPPSVLVDRCGFEHVRKQQGLAARLQKILADKRAAAAFLRVFASGFGFGKTYAHDVSLQLSLLLDFGRERFASIKMPAHGYSCGPAVLALS